MNLISAQKIKNLCEKYNVRPNKKLGQNFLIDKNILDKIISVADLKKNDIVLEIGPGFGILTEELAKRVKKVFAIEIDKRLTEALKENLLNYRNIEIINKDILKVGAEELKLKKYKVVANLPYQITSAIIRKFLENRPQPELMVFMVQKEVAEKICAEPSDMSLLSVSVQFYCEPKIISRISKNSFWPIPKVGSAILKLVSTKMRRDVDSEKFFKIVRTGFSKPRKQLKNNLRIDPLVLKKIGLDEKVRAEELSVEDWMRLTDLVD